jgi:hypothetical protein
MAKSKKRGGDKAHAKKIAARNQTIKNQKNAVQRMFDESMKKQLEELQKQYDVAKSVPQEPSSSPQNASEMMLTTNDDIISSIPSDDEMSDWDVTLMDGLEEESIFHEESKKEEETQKFSTIEDKSDNSFQ